MKVKYKHTISIAILILLSVLLLYFSFFKNKDVIDIVEKKIVKECFVQNKDCEVFIKNRKVKFSTDEHIYYLKPFFAKVLVEDKFGLNIESIKVEFKMKGMNMGLNNYSLNRFALENNKTMWKGKVVLPVCITGRKEWFVSYKIKFSNEIYTVIFPVNVL